MRWSFRSEQAQASPRVERSAPEGELELHRSPGLEAALIHLDEHRPYGILDLGRATAPTVSFFTRFRCRLRIVDLLDQLADGAGGSLRLERQPAALFAELIPDPRASVDLILAWNVFDHLPREAARQLALRIARVARPGARLFALIGTGRESRGGITFAIHDRANLEYRSTAPPIHRDAAFNPAAFEQLLSGFAIDRSFVLRHGYHEYVAVRAEDAHGADCS